MRKLKINQHHTMLYSAIEIAFYSNDTIIHHLSFIRPRDFVLNFKPIEHLPLLKIKGFIFTQDKSLDLIYWDYDLSNMLPRYIVGS